MRGMRTLLLVAFAAIAASPLAAQITDPAAQLQINIRNRSAQIAAVQKKMRDAPGTLTSQETPAATINLQRDIDSIYLGLIQPVSQRALQALEERRADKQLGEAAGSTAGSTSLVAKGGTPAILALAVENGALTQSVSGTTVTIRGTPVSLIRGLRRTGYFDTLTTDDDGTRALEKFSFAVSFDTSRGLAEGEEPTLTANRGQLSAASLRFSAVDRKDPRAAHNDDRWRMFAFTQMELDEAALEAFQALRVDPGVGVWLVATQQAIASSPLDQIEQTVVAQFAALASVEITPATRAAVQEAGEKFEGLLRGRADVLRDIAGGRQLVFDWNYQRPATGAESSSLKVVGSVGRALILTGNGSVTLYHRRPAGTDLLRDIQAAVQFDVPIGNPDTVGRYVVSLSTKVQHMPTDLVAPEGSLFPGTKGTIWLGQLKLTIPVRGSVAAKIPVSVTLANRTELIAEEKVFARANVGFSYDLDAVFARFKP
jgi:hypothetical protein